MNWDQVEGNWEKFKGAARQQWGELTDDDLQKAKGDRQRMAGLIQERYGRTREQAERELDDWAARH
ncbi:CsbD family protein [Roseivivax sp. CAU 1761]